MWRGGGRYVCLQDDWKGDDLRFHVDHLVELIVEAEDMSDNADIRWVMSKPTEDHGLVHAHHLVAVVDCPVDDERCARCRGDRVWEAEALEALKRFADPSRPYYVATRASRFWGELFVHSKPLGQRATRWLYARHLAARRRVARTSVDQ